MSTLSGRFVTVLLVVAVAISLPTGARSAGSDATAGQPPTSPATGAGVPPAIVNVTESIAVVDRPVALPPAVIDIRESVGVSDKSGGSPPPTEPTPKRTP